MRLRIADWLRRNGGRERPGTRVVARGSAGCGVHAGGRKGPVVIECHNKDRVLHKAFPRAAQDISNRGETSAPATTTSSATASSATTTAASSATTARQTATTTRTTTCESVWCQAK